jgi:predicted kinase
VGAAASTVQPVLVVLVGPPASGKSTLARLLAARLPAVLVQSDAVRKALVAQPTYTPAEHRRVFGEAHRQIVRLLRAGQHVVFDATNLAEVHRRVLYRIAGACGARLLIARLAVPEAVARTRLARRQTARDPGDLSDADWAVYQRMAARREPIAPPHWVLNAAAAPEALAALLLRAAARAAPAPPPQRRPAAETPQSRSEGATHVQASC